MQDTISEALQSLADALSPHASFRRESEAATLIRWSDEDGDWVVRVGHADLHYWLQQRLGANLKPHSKAWRQAWSEVATEAMEYLFARYEADEGPFRFGRNGLEAAQPPTRFMNEIEEFRGA